MAENQSNPPLESTSIPPTLPSTPPATTTPFHIPTATPIHFPTATIAVPSPPPYSILTVKLTNDNYMLWKAQIVPYLRGHNLYRFVDGTNPPPQVFDEMSEPNSSTLLWFQQDQAVLSILISSLSEPLIAHVLDAKTSRDVWLTLEIMFTASSQARVMQILFQLNTLRKGPESIAEYYGRAKLLVDTLAMAGKIVPTAEFICYLLTGLDDDYAPIVNTITTLTAQAQPLTMAQVYSHLLTYESRQSHKTSTLTAGNDLSANNTTKHSPQSYVRGRGNYRGRGGLRGRGGRGRFGGQGLLPTPPPFNTPKPTCQVCHKSGHTADACYHRFNYNYQPPPPPSLTAHLTTGPSHHYSSPSITDPSWYPDTAASHHFTNDFSNLTLNPTEYQGHDQVRVGNGSSLPIHHVGSSTISSSNGFNNSEGSSSRTY